MYPGYFKANLKVLINSERTWRKALASKQCLHLITNLHGRSEEAQSGSRAAPAFPLNHYQPVQCSAVQGLKGTRLMLPLCNLLCSWVREHLQKYAA